MRTFVATSRWPPSDSSAIDSPRCAARATVKAIEVPSGSSPPQPLANLVPRIASLLLISAGRSVEYGYNVAYARATRPTTEHCNLPVAHYTAAIREHPREYDRGVVACFDEVLL